MSFLNSLNIVASGLTAQQQRLDVISENITNSATTRTEQGGAYRRKMVVFEAQNSGASFRSAIEPIGHALHHEQQLFWRGCLV